MGKILKKLFDLFIFSSLFIALCAVVMVTQTYQLLDLEPGNNNYLWFVFFSTICSYNFHWYLTPNAEGENDRSAWTQKHKSLHIALFLIGFLCSGWFFFKFLNSWIWMIGPVVLTFLYSAPKLPYKPFSLLKKVAIGKTVFLAFVWMYVTSLLPILLYDEGVRVISILFCLSRFSLIYAICILFDYRDRENDQRDGIRSMITYFSEKGINILFYLSFLVFILSTIALYWFGFDTLTIILLLTPGIIVVILYGKAKRNFSDYLYYFILDGLMMFSSILTFFLPF